MGLSELEKELEKLKNDLNTEIRERRKERVSSVKITKMLREEIKSLKEELKSKEDKRKSGSVASIYIEKLMRDLRGED